MSRTNEMQKITEGVIWKQLLIFFFPILLGTFFQQMYNTVDTIIVGRYVGTQALAAVGATGALISLLNGFFVGLGTGATVLLSQFYGGGDREGVRKSLHTGMGLSLILGAVIMLLGVIAARPILTATRTPENCLAGSTLYTKIYFSGAIASMVYNMGSGILRAMGDSRRPTLFLVAACIANILMDILLVVVFKMGIAGAAIATVVSQVVSAVLVVGTLMRLPKDVRLEIQALKMEPELLKRILYVGVPAGFQFVTFDLANLLIQSGINSFGDVTVAAWTAYSKTDAMTWMISGAFSVSIITFIGQNYGAGKYDRMKKSVKVCLLLDFIASLLVSALLLFLGQYLLQLFTTDPEVIRIGMEIIRIIAPSYVLFIFIEILSSALRGMGNVLVPMIMTCTGVCILRILWIFLAVPHWPGVQSILMSYPISWGLTAVLFIVYYYFDQKKFYKNTPRR